MFNRLFDFNMNYVSAFVRELSDRLYHEKSPLRCEVAVTREEVPFRTAV